MDCPFCGAKMAQGKAAFLPIQGFAQVMVSFTGEEEAQKRFWKRKTQDTVLSAGEEAAAYYCASCQKLLPVLPLK